MYKAIGIMEKLSMFGKDMEYLIEIITNQSKHNTSVSIDTLFNEVRDNFHQIDGYQIVTCEKILGRSVNPEKLYKSNNFQYALETPYLVLLNKFY